MAAATAATGSRPVSVTTDSPFAPSPAATLTACGTAARSASATPAGTSNALCGGGGAGRSLPSPGPNRSSPAGWMNAAASISSKPIATSRSASWLATVAVFGAQTWA